MLEEILTVYVKLEDTVWINGNTVNVNMIRFSGYAESRYFKGKILPGGVDLQRGKTDGVMNLSARYIMEGTDIENHKCRIFIENNGFADEKGIIKTKPVVVTDSKALGWLEAADLEGSITSEDDMVIIHICKCVS